MITDLIEKHHLTPAHCYMVGDKLIDAEAGRNAGIQGIVVRQENKSDFPYFKNLMDFANSLKK
jgi:histidinol phosphatase-like enzyme